MSHKQCDLRKGSDITDATKAEMGIEGVLRSVLSSDCSTKLILYDMKHNVYRGIVETDSCSILIDWNSKKHTTVCADLWTHEMRMYDGEEITSISTNVDCIDMEASGRRWEGGVKDEKPFGYGILFDEEGKKEYEGFMMGSDRICCGREYYSDIDRVKYDGCYHSGIRFGTGILYDRSGSVEYEGFWKEDTIYSENNDDSVSCLQESLVIPDNTFNDANDVVLLPLFLTLKELVIGSDCFERSRVFELNGLRQLESIVTEKRTGKVGDFAREDGLLRIADCPKLKSVVIGEDSFCDYYAFVLENLPSLESISMTGLSFYWAPVFSLTSWNS